MFEFLKEKCNHKFCEYVVLEKYTEEDSEDAFLASNHGGVVREYAMERRLCKHCEKVYTHFIKAVG
jgi:hypothetical protein